MRKLSLTALAAFVFAFATTSSAEVVRSHKGKNKNQAQIVPVAFTGAPASSLKGLGKGKANKHKESAASSQMLAAPAISTVTKAPKTRAKHKGGTGSAVTGVSPLFLPVGNVTPTVANVSASGGLTGHRFKKNHVNTPTTPSVAAASVAAVPEPPFTSLMLMGLFGAALVVARRFHANSVVP